MKHKWLGILKNLGFRGVKDLKIEIKERIAKYKKSETPDGYKNIKLGIIPNDWSIKPLKEFSSKISDGIHSTPKYSEDGEYYFINGNNLNNGKIRIDENTKKIMYEEYLKLKQTLCSSTLLLSINGTIGNCAYYNREKVLLGKSACYININEKSSIHYIYYAIQSAQVIAQFNNELTGSTIKNLSLKAIRETLLPFMKIKEQNKIATILSTWDEAIELKEQLIESKKQQKKGLMRKLLTGKVRMPGFDGEWKEVRLEDIAIQSTQKNTENQEIRVLSCTKYDGLVDSLEYFGRKMFSEDISKYKLVKKEEICYATNHIEEGSIGILDEYDIGLVSPMYTVFRIDPHYNSGYIFRILKSDSYVELYKSLMSASVNRRGSLRWKEFSKIKIKLPPVDEQIEIANLMNLMDKNLELLEQELAALKLQKKGLMQLLLTGIVRVQC